MMRVLGLAVKECVKFLFQYFIYSSNIAWFDSTCISVICESICCESEDRLQINDIAREGGGEREGKWGGIGRRYSVNQAKAIFWLCVNMETIEIFKNPNKNFCYCIFHKLGFHNSFIFLKQHPYQLELIKKILSKLRLATSRLA